MPEESASASGAWPVFIQPAEAGWYLRLKVQPGAKKNELCGESEGCLRLRLAAPAVDNKANTALLNFLTEILRVKKNRIRLVSGEKSRRKKIFIPADARPVFTALAQPETFGQ
jgi:uncharacterized protein (TIGR00251 family)